MYADTDKAHFAGPGMEAHESENPLNFESVRASWIAKQLKAREASFTKTYDITYVRSMVKFTIALWVVVACNRSPFRLHQFESPFSPSNTLHCAALARTVV